MTGHKIKKKNEQLKIKQVMNNFIISSNSNSSVSINFNSSSSSSSSSEHTEELSATNIKKKIEAEFYLTLSGNPISVGIKAKDSITCSRCSWESQYTNHNKLKSHITGENISGARALECRNPNQTIKTFIRKELAAAKLLVEEEKKRKRESDTQNMKNKLVNLFGKEANTLADLAIAKCLVVNGIAPAVLDSKAWREMVSTITQASTNYTGPNRKDFSCKNSFDVAVNGAVPKFGRVMEMELENASLAKKMFLDNILNIGGTIVSDGAKNFKRSSLNTSLQTSKGNLFIQSTNATGMYNIYIFIYIYIHI
jgi:hypothetical protein